MACSIRRHVALMACALLFSLANSALGCTDTASALAAHNTKRAGHGSPAMTWDATLASSAQTWANYLATQQCQLTHSGPGENLAAQWSTGSLTSSCVYATNAWYNEISDYLFTQTPYTDNFVRNNKMVGHFTQVVWAGSTRLGCASASGYGGPFYPNCVVQVCHYGGPGNYVGDSYFLANVKPLGSSGSVQSPPPPRPPSPAPSSSTVRSPPSPPPPSPSPSSSGGGSTGTCADLLDWCPDWASSGYCSSEYYYDGQSVPYYQCKQSCGQCAPSNAPCQDTLSICPVWAASGYCAPQYVTMAGDSVKYVACKASCGTCTSGKRRLMKQGAIERRMLNEKPRKRKPSDKPCPKPDMVKKGDPAVQQYGK